MSQNGSASSYWLIGLATIAVFGLIAFAIFWNSIFPRTNRNVALACTNGLAIKYHMHYDLKIIAEGQEKIIPANIGLTQNCMRAIHTHDEGGTVHIESPEKRDFALSDFFAVWGEIFSKDEILGYKTDLDRKIKMTVNGKESSDYENFVPQDDDKIVIYLELQNAVK